MGLLDDIMKQSGGLAGIADLVAKNPQLLSAALSMLSTKDTSVGDTSGLGGLMSAFQSKGLGDIVSSWISTSANKSVSPGDLQNVLGDKTLSQFAQKAGIGTGEAGSVLASLLPVLVDQLTPKGQVPETNDFESALGSLLSGFGR